MLYKPYSQTEAIDMPDLSEKIEAGHYDDRFEILQENYFQLSP